MKFSSFLMFSSLCFISTWAMASGYNSAPASIQFQQQPLKFHLKSTRPNSHDNFVINSAHAGQSKQLVILLGGGPGFSSWNLQPIQKAVAAWNKDVVLMDMIGIGENRDLLNKALVESNPQQLLHTWNQQIHAVQSHWQSLTGIKEPAVVIGHSWGALMAMLYAREFPLEVAKIILLNPVDPEKKAMQNLTREIDLRNRTELNLNWDDEANWEHKTEVAESELDRITLKQIKQVLPTYFLNYQQGVEYAEQFGLDDFNIDLNVIAWKAYDANPITYPQLQKLNKPSYFLECKQDYLMPYNLNAMQQHIEFTGKHLIDGCGHFPWIEQPQAFYRTLQSFIED